MQAEQIAEETQGPPDFFECEVGFLSWCAKRLAARYPRSSSFRALGERCEILQNVVD